MVCDDLDAGLYHNSDLVATLNAVTKVDRDGEELPSSTTAEGNELATGMRRHHQHPGTGTASKKPDNPCAEGPQREQVLCRQRILQPEQMLLNKSATVEASPCVFNSFAAAAMSSKDSSGYDAFPKSSPSKFDEAGEKVRRPRKPSARLIESLQKDGSDLADADGQMVKRARSDIDGDAGSGPPSLPDALSTVAPARTITVPKPSDPLAASNSAAVRRPAAVTTDGTDVEEGGRDPLFVGCPIRIRRVAGDWSSGRILSRPISSDSKSDGDRRQILLADGTRTTLRLYPLQARSEGGHEGRGAE